MARQQEVVLGLVWQLPDELNAKELEKKLKAFMARGDRIEVSLSPDLGLPANGATLESVNTRTIPKATIIK